MQLGVPHVSYLPCCLEPRRVDGIGPAPLTPAGGAAGAAGQWAGGLAGSAQVRGVAMRCTYNTAHRSSDVWGCTTSGCCRYACAASVLPPALLRCEPLATCTVFPGQGDGGEGAAAVPGLGRL